MALKPAICTQCGADIEVDDAKEAGICKYCGTPFITEKVIANYTNNYTTVNNITNNVTKIIHGKESDDAENAFNRGLTNLKLKKYSEAEDNFEKATDLSPEVSKYYMYKFIAKTRGFKYSTFPVDVSSEENDLISFFALTTEEEKEKFAKEYGLDCSCYEAFLVDAADAIYLKRHFHFCSISGRNEESEDKICYDRIGLFYVERIFAALKQEEHKQKFEEKVFKSVSEILKDKRQGSVLGISDIFPSRSLVNRLQDCYDDVDIFCIALYRKLADYMPRRREEFYDLLAQRMYFVDKTAGILYLKSTSYLPKKNFAYATTEVSEDGIESVTIRADDPDIHTIVLGGDCRYFEKFVLTKNITEVKEVGKIKVDFSGYSRRYDEYAKEYVNYFEVGAGCRTAAVTSVKNRFVITKRFYLNKEAGKEKFRAILVGSVVIAAVVLLLIFLLR